MSSTVRTVAKLGLDIFYRMNLIPKGVHALINPWIYLKKCSMSKVVGL